MTRFDKIMESAKPETLAKMLRCPAEYDGSVENCGMSGEFCRKCILGYLNGQAEPDAKKEVKHKCGAYGNVLLTDTEKRKLQEEYGYERTEKAIEYLGEYMQLKRYTVKSHYLALRKWVFDAVREQDIRKRELERKSRDYERETSGRLDFDLEKICETPRR